MHKLYSSVSQFRSFKWSARHQALQWPDKEPFIWIRCGGGGKHRKHAGQWVMRTGIEKHCCTASCTSIFCSSFLLFPLLLVVSNCTQSFFLGLFQKRLCGICNNAVYCEWDLGHYSWTIGPTIDMLRGFWLRASSPELQSHAGLKVGMAQ